MWLLNAIYLLWTIIHHWEIDLLWNKMLLQKAISYHKNTFFSVTENWEIRCKEFSENWEIIEVGLNVQD